MGRLGRAGAQAERRARANPAGGGSSLGEITFLPLSVTRMRLWQLVVAGHVAALSESSNAEAAVTNLPLREH
jgi:hypothetical protein